MKSSTLQRIYEPEVARALAPLLDSIAHEIEERTAAVERIEARLEELRESPFFDPAVEGLRADAATHRRELRHCREELERLGCTVVGTSPMTIRIPTREGQHRRSSVWQPGEGTRTP